MSIQKIPVKLKRRMPATTVILLGFLAVILLGTLLLILPVSSRSGCFTDPETAAFTAVSATCVTGLVIVDTMTYWSTFGQIVILCMIQIGGLGFMTLAMFLSMLVKRTITPRERVIAAQALGLNSTEGTVKLARRILTGTFLVEGAGAVVLSTQFIPIFGWADGIYRGIFHAVSAFCNAGFDLMGDFSGSMTSLNAFCDNYVVNLTVMLLVIIGGIGFIIWDDICCYISRRDPLTVYSKFILIVTAILIFGGAAAFFCFEFHNEATMAGLNTGERILASFFQSVTTRTAGFSTIDNGLFTPESKVISIILMLIGGASGSTAGGLKVGTVGIVLYTVFRVAAGHTDVVIFRRKVSQENVLRAISIVGIGLLLLVSFSLAISVSDGVDLIPAVYEVASAIATVGLSLSLTPSLSLFGHILLMFLMFFGRVGILTVTFSMMLRLSSRQSCISYPETNMMIG